MRKITMNPQSEKTMSEVFEMFIISQSAKGVSDTTLRNYRYHIRNISKYLDIQMLFDTITKTHIDLMVVEMRKA